MPPHVLFAFGEYDCVFVLGLVVFRGDGVVVDQFVFVGARLFALLAVNAKRCVVKKGFAHESLSWPVRDRKRARAEIRNEIDELTVTERR